MSALLRPMTAADIPAVMAIELASFAEPWSAGIFAEELGAVWVTRPDNTHAKAGNINHALTVTRGDLVLILDADHVPLPDALEDLVGYFQDPALARAQSPHDCSTTTPVNTTRWAGTSSRSSSRSSARARITTAGFPDGMGDRLGASIDRM